MRPQILRPTILGILLTGIVAGSIAAGPSVETLAPGVYAVLQPADNRFNDSNSLFVVREDGVLVVDTQATLESTAQTIAAIRARTDLPVRHLVLTHWHGDHVHGIAAYRKLWPEVEVIAHASLAEDVRDRAQPQLDGDIELYTTAIRDAHGRLERRVDREGNTLDEDGVARLSAQIEDAEGKLATMRALPSPLTGPSLSYTTEVGLAMGVRLLHRKAHTRGDTLVFLPKEGILATGDVLDDLPFGGHGYPAVWVDVLKEIETMGVGIVVPGHGSVRRGNEHPRRVRELYEALVSQVRAAVERGEDLETTQAGMDLSRFRAALVGDDEQAAQAWVAFIPATVERAWLEARGELPD